MKSLLITIKPERDEKEKNETNIMLVIVSIFIVFVFAFFIGFVFGDINENVNVPDVPADTVYTTELDTYPEYETFIARAYCGCKECNGIWSDGTVAKSSTGTKLEQGVSVAADFSVLPPFTQIEVSGLGIYTVHDCGSAIKGNEIDVYFDNHEDAQDFGVKKVRVKVCETV